MGGNVHPFTPMNWRTRRGRGKEKHTRKTSAFPGGQGKELFKQREAGGEGNHSRKVGQARRRSQGRLARGFPIGGGERQYLYRPQRGEREKWGGNNLKTYANQDSGPPPGPEKNMAGEATGSRSESK